MGAGVSEVRKQGAESVELVDKGHEIPTPLSPFPFHHLY
ncbi:uncharacterized protein G2W53_037430 [Senna tora]|uniref:Uncharacterized protein n=1 Tax=Senna tora TaxID=362788 RepID=A0A834SW00_9FABA|nr:uncharacterized protein G2W53_037430 [Senna tora]